MKRIAILFALFACLGAFLMMPAPVLASGGGGSNPVDTIKVSKCYYAGGAGYVELLLNANSSNPTAHLYAYLPSGACLGEVQNGGGGKYGGTVFLTFSVPDTITFKSSAGGSVIVSCAPFQP